MNNNQIQQALRDIGWPVSVDGAMGAITQQAIRDFQGGLSLGYELSIDGVAGRRTQDALRQSLDLGGKCGANFYFREFKSKGNGWIRVSRHLVAGLDRYRWRYGPTTIISGYRDPAHNRRVGGASASRHMKGDAADLRPQITVQQARDLGFQGIGYNRSSGRVAHVDMRPGGLVVWRYGR